jgi:hypothetical protein
LLLAFATAAQARTWVVDPQGSGNFSTIFPAIAAASVGDTVLLYPGRYLDFSVYSVGTTLKMMYVHLNKTNLVLRGVDRDRVILGPTSYPWTTTDEPVGIFVTPHATGCALENLTIQNITVGSRLGTATTMRDVRIVGADQAIIGLAESPFVWDRVLVEDCRSRAVSLGSQAPSSTIRACTFRGSSAAVAIFGTGRLDLSECRFVDGSQLSFQTGVIASVRHSSFEPGSLSIGYECQIELTHCTFGPSERVQLCILRGAARIYRNVFHDSAQSNILVGNSSDVIANYNDFLNEPDAGDRPTVMAFDYFAAPRTSLNFKQNWWNTTDAEQISHWIEDVHDQANSVLSVDFQPFLLQSIPVQRQSWSEFKSKFVSKKP